MPSTQSAGPRHRAHGRRSRSRKIIATASSVLLGAGLVPAALLATPAAQAAPVGQGFNLNASDLRFILKQIKISERHASTATAASPCATLLGPAADQIPNQANQGVELPFGLRTVDGSCNNLLTDQNGFGSGGKTFPRLVPANFRSAEAGDPDGPGPAPSVATSYEQTKGVVFDSQPRLASNLIVDQTATNPAAVAAAGLDPATTPSGAFFIPNVAPDVGLSAPYNSWFTLFGQFFDHGLDLTSKSGGTVFMPLKADDPLFDPASQTNFMVLTRSTNQPGPDGVVGDDPATAQDESADDVKNATNRTSSFVDQSQTYTSHPSHQVFLRAYESNALGKPVGTGKLITGPGNGMADWTAVKAQARTLLGIELSDADALSIPLLATDPYGRFTRGPNGYPQMVVPSAPGGVREGNPASPITTAGATKTGHAFLDDIAHHAVPGLVDHDGNPATPKVQAVPDSDPGSTDDNNPATYDDEMLGAHFIAGDGRVNENIGLTSVHHVFHSEHNRLTGVIDDMVTNDPAFSAAERADWRTTAGPSGWDYAERIFQAARFVTEMEYQHLAFEEFARKVQPQVNLFSGYDASVNPAIAAEFAHAVYRFGHSMLTENVARTSAKGANRDIPLLDAFLNPPSFLAGGLNAEQAAGSVVRGMTEQVGNELDEFVTEALRNRLLGLPLDLASLNMARAREAGVPSLNAARRSFHAATNGNAALAPYANWNDFGFALKRHESLINFVAAYGKHPSITGSMAARRAAAALLVSNGVGAPADSAAFMEGNGTWANGAGGVTTTGLDDVDLWVGGLAEKIQPFGGLLGNTFNYVFERQMENLQDGDRLYYLSRTAGLNMLVQLEGNSFAELIQRNTDVTNLPADSFSRPDLKFCLVNQPASGPIVDDPATDYDEATLLTRMSDNTIRFNGPEHVVFGGTPGDDKVWSSEGDDTIRGNDGNDRLEGGAGNDGILGGLGQDVITDLFGDDVTKGGDGNDAISSGQGFDLNQAGRGHDFVIGGSDPTETFGSSGNDLIFGGDSFDTVFGDDGDDWIEGGGQADLLQGDNGAPFQDDPNTPGNDIIDGDGGADDFDSEGGDDIMVSGPGVERSEGMLGFDWVTHSSDPVAANSDLNVTGLLPPSLDTLRDRFDMVEGLSGWTFDDVLRGDDADATTMVGHELDAAGIARVTGLADELPVAATSFTGGNIILGGAGSDLIEGRGGDDIIDGDAWLRVQLRSPDLTTADPTDAKLVDGMTVDADGAGPQSSLQQDVFAGRINPGDITAVRSIQTTGASGGTDTAVFSGAQADYTVVENADSVTVTDGDGTGPDGSDTLRNIEQLTFQNGTPDDLSDDGPPVSVASLGGTIAEPAAGTITPSAPPAPSAAEPTCELLQAQSPVVTPPVVTPPIGTPPIVVPPVGVPPVLAGGAVSPGNAVRASITSRLSKAAVNVGTKVTLGGRVTPFKGVTLTLTKRVASGRSSLAGRKLISTTAANGTYSFRLPTAKSGVTSYAVTVSGPGVIQTAGTRRKRSVYSARVTSVAPAGAENVAVKNTGKVTVNLAGWKLKDASGKSLTLPRYSLKPGATVRVYTGKGVRSARRIFLAKRSNVWDRHDTTKLYDRNGIKVSTRKY